MKLDTLTDISNTQNFQFIKFKVHQNILTVNAGHSGYRHARYGTSVFVYLFFYMVQSCRFMVDTEIASYWYSTC